MTGPSEAVPDASQLAIRLNQTWPPYLNGAHSPAERTWLDDDPGAAESRFAALAPLVSLGFVAAALRRSAWLCCGLAAAGLIAGLGAFLASPPPYQASTSLILNEGPGYNPSAITDDQAIAASRTVAGLVVHALGLKESVSGFLGSYSVTAATDRVLIITVSAATSKAAVSRANAVAAQFLRLRARTLETSQRLVAASLVFQVGQAKQRIRSIKTQIAGLARQPASPLRQARLDVLQADLALATSALTVLEQSTNSYQASTQESTALMVHGSEVLDPAALLPRPGLRHLALYGAVGMLFGLILGVGLVVLRAFTSDRLRRRDEVAGAIGAPVKLSVGAVRVRRRRAGGRGRHQLAETPEIKRIVAQLRTAASASSRGGAALALIPVDEPRAAAMALVTLAVSHARHGEQVILADLCAGAPAARLLGAREPGLHKVDVQDAHLLVAIPDRDDAAPVGPLSAAQAPAAEHRDFTEAVAGFCRSADLMLTLISLDPAVGGEHLATWAGVAVALVTAGRSSATRINGVGEMVRLAGTRLDSVVLVGADKADESLGIAHAPDISGGAAAGAEDSDPQTDRLGGSVNRRPVSADPAGQPQITR